MDELYPLHHAEASFGTDNYDQLSELNHQQSQSLGRALGCQGVSTNLFYTGDIQRHRETLEVINVGLGFNKSPFKTHTGLNEVDFTGLPSARFRKGGVPALMHKDRKVRFKIQRDTVLAWPQNQIKDPPESWRAFCARSQAARQMMMVEELKTVPSVSSGSVIDQIIAVLLQKPTEKEIKLQLQFKNCAINKFVFSARFTYLYGFIETPHGPNVTTPLLSYS